MRPILIFAAAVASVSAFQSGSAGTAATRRSLYVDDSTSAPTKYLSPVVPKISAGSSLPDLFPRGQTGVAARVASDFALQSRRCASSVRVKKAGRGLLRLARCFLNVHSRREVNEVTTVTSAEYEIGASVSTVDDLVRLAERAALFEQTLESTRRTAAEEFLRSRIRSRTSAVIGKSLISNIVADEEKALWKRLWTAEKPEFAFEEAQLAPSM